MKFRTHRGSFKESLELMVDLETTPDALRLHLSHTLGGFYSPEKTLSVEFYGFDPRINWDTYIVKLNGYPVGFINGPLV